MEHPALNATRKGIEAGLEEGGYLSGVNLQLRYESAQANPLLAQQIAAKFISLRPDMVVAIATVAAQSFAKTAWEGRVRLIFSSVTDPLSADLVDSLEKPGRNSSGVSNFVPLEPQVELMKELLPNLKTIGFPYSPAEANSLLIIRKLRELLPKHGIRLVEQAIVKMADISQGVEKLLDSADLLLVSNDNMMLSAIAHLIQLARNRNKPVIVSDTDLVEQGALAALGPNQYQVGVQTGRMVVRVLKGADIGKEAVEFPTAQELFLNLKTARQLAIEIPSELLSRANKVYSD